MSEYVEGLEKGDFVYQSDSELFLVVIENNENSVRFAVHGWREIGKDRLDEYLDHKNGKLFSQDKLTKLIDEKGDEDDIENFEQLLELVNSYRDVDVDADQMIDDYALKDK